MPTLSDPDTDHHASADCVVAATLCLMSCFVQHRLSLYAERITANLQLLACHANLTIEMRTVCARLTRRWDAIRAESVDRATLAGTPADTRSLH